MPVPTSEWLVYHETYSGPFNKDYDVEFPAWAPHEDDNEYIKTFMSSLNMHQY
jgi:glucose-6-phosphate isomerase